MTPQEIINEAIKKDISVIALTDHHTAKNIDTIKSLAKNNNISVISGIEFRTEYGSKSVHMIGLFPDKFNNVEITSKLLQDDVLSALGLSESAITRKGRESNSTLSDDDAFSKGMFLVQVDFKKAAIKIREFGGIVVVHAGSKENSIDKEMKHVGISAKNVNFLYESLGTVKDELLKEYIDICEIRKNNDSEAFYLKKFNRPSIIASDAHSLDEVGSKYVWIKADATFEGLKQILCEPYDRVKIQEIHPEERKSYNIIDRVIFTNSKNNTFQTNDIGLSNGLNAIIGGKSSGKSLLLNMMATEMGAANTKSKDYIDVINGAKIEVYYKDDPKQKRNSSDGRKVEFLPQLYINDLVSNKEQIGTVNRSFNTFIEDLIRQDDNIKTTMDSARNQIGLASSTIDADITEWIRLDRQLSLEKEERSKLGDKKAIENEIERISSQIELLKQSAGWTIEEKELYDRLIKENDANNAKLTSLDQENTELNILKTYLDQKNHNEILSAITVTSEITVIDNLIERIKTSISNDIHKTTKQYISEIIENINNNLQSIKLIKEMIAINSTSIQPLVTKNTAQSEIEKSEKAKTEEEGKIMLINEKDKEIQTTREKVTNLRFISCSQTIIDIYYKLSTSLNTAISEKWDVDTTKLSISTKAEFKSSVFVDSIISVANNRSYLGNQFNENLNIFDANEYKYDKVSHLSKLEKLINFAIRETDRYSNFKSGKNSKEFLSALLKDCFTIEYDVVKGGDSLHKMSEGKKGIVILQLYLSLSGSDCPILIDQPEDNLDNRTVYKELNDYIKQCKNKRQIILVSHNANLVVNTDAENVIVANQSGEDGKENKDYKFEYVNGALENTFFIEANNGEEPLPILHKQGIREHVCEILEGGVDAFKKREIKYHI